MPPKKTTTVKRTVTKTTVPRGVRSKVVAIKRRYKHPTSIINDPNLTGAAGSFVFYLSDCPAYTDFTQLFDAYRIVKAKVDFLPSITGNDYKTNGSTSQGWAGLTNWFHYCTDGTDAEVPSNKEVVMAYENSRTILPYKPFSVSLRPAPAASYWQGLTASGYGPRAGAWIDKSSPSVQHYGVKYVWNHNGPAGCRIDAFVTMWLEFKDAQ